MTYKKAILPYKERESFEQRVIFLVISSMTDFLRLYVVLPFIELKRKRLSGL